MTRCELDGPNGYRRGFGISACGAATRKATDCGKHLVQLLLAGTIEDAQVHRSGVQIDAAVECVRLLVETHHGSPWAWVRALEPASWWEGVDLPENPTLGQRLGVASLVPLGQAPGPSQRRP